MASTASIPRGCAGLACNSPGLAQNMLKYERLGG